MIRKELCGKIIGAVMTVLYGLGPGRGGFEKPISNLRSSASSAEKSDILGVIGRFFPQISRMTWINADIMPDDFRKTQRGNNWRGDEGAE
jgi:hypothetical protein